MNIYEIVEKIHQRTGCPKNELVITSDETNLHCILTKELFKEEKVFPIPQDDEDIDNIIKELSLIDKHQSMAKRLNDISA